MLSDDFRQALLQNETNLEVVSDLFFGNEDLYEEILDDFLDDQTIFELKKAIDLQEWDNAFTAAHALKGLAGNLGLTPLFHCIGELVIAIRTARISDITITYNKSKKYYDDIVNVIKTNSQKLIEKQ